MANLNGDFNLSFSIDSKNEREINFHSFEVENFFSFFFFF